MNNSYTQKLYADFPRLYRDAMNHMSMMKFGFGCNDGWFDLIYKLSADIETEAKVLGLDPNSDAWPKAIQVKEKHGTLKFYCDAGEKRELPNGDLGLVPEVAGRHVSFRPVPNVQSIRALISKAENDSATVCEGCGCQGKMRKDGWQRVLCDDCEDIRQKRNIVDGSKYADTYPINSLLTAGAANQSRKPAGSYMEPTSTTPGEAAGIILADFSILFMNELANNKNLDCPVWTTFDIAFTVGQIDEMFHQSAPPFDRLKMQCNMLFQMAHTAGMDPKEVTDGYFDFLELIGAMERGEPLPLHALSDESVRTIANPSRSYGSRYTPQLEKKVIYGYLPKRKGDKGS